MRRLIIATMCVGVLVAAAAVAFAQGNRSLMQDQQVSMVFVSQNEADMERAIAAYIEKVHDISAVIMEVPNAPGDVYLRYGLSPREGPSIQAYVDTMISAKSGDQVIERVIRIQAYYVLPDAAKTPEARAAILELNNSYLRRRWAPSRVFIDSDGDISFQTHINVPASDVPIHAEMVYDALARMTSAWSQYYEELKEVVPTR